MRVVLRSSHFLIDPFHRLIIAAQMHDSTQSSSFIFPIELIVMPVTINKSYSTYYYLEIRQYRYTAQHFVNDWITKTLEWKLLGREVICLDSEKKFKPLSFICLSHILHIYMYFSSNFYRKYRCTKLTTNNRLSLEIKKNDIKMPLKWIITRMSLVALIAMMKASQHVSPL